MTIVYETMTPPCIFEPEVFHDENLHNPPARHEVSAAEWRELQAKRADAHRKCAGCPLMVDCLYRAVVEVDVSGFVACTSETDRQRMRAELGIQVAQPAFPFGGARVGGGPLSHDAVMSMRHAYPKDTCGQLAERLDCSTSTIKRHMRRAREMKKDAASGLATVPSLPTIDDVLDCFDGLESSQVA
jgi:hypothetical protein